MGNYENNYILIIYHRHQKVGKTIISAVPGIATCRFFRFTNRERDHHHQLAGDAQNQDIDRTLDNQIVPVYKYSYIKKV